MTLTLIQYIHDEKFVPVRSALAVDPVKVRVLFQRYQCIHAAGSVKNRPLARSQAMDFLPLALRAFRTFLPPGVLILARKPWTFTSFFLGWNVIFMVNHLLFSLIGEKHAYYRKTSLSRQALFIRKQKDFRSGVLSGTPSEKSHFPLIVDILWKTIFFLKSALFFLLISVQKCYNCGKPGRNAGFSGKSILRPLWKTLGRTVGNFPFAKSRHRAGYLLSTGGLRRLTISADGCQGMPRPL